MIMEAVRRGWSESVSQYNLICYCLHPRSKVWERIIGFFTLTNMPDGMKYVERVEFTNDLRELIFDELKMKSKIAENLGTAKKINSARGDWVLWYEGCADLLPWINEVNFDESLLLWHFATELCFSTGQGPGIDINAHEGGNGKGRINKDFRGLSKHLSDYLLYLLIMQPTMMSTLIGNGEIRYRYTCADVKGKMGSVAKNKKYGLNSLFCCFKKSCCCGGKTRKDVVQKQACEIILIRETSTEEPAFFEGGTGRQSVLFDACKLAEELNKLEVGRKWEIISKVWVEMLSYAACRCRANVHAAQLSKGGQLITLVWLLMAHLGLGNKFETIEWDGKVQTNY